MSESERAEMQIPIELFQIIKGSRYFVRCKNFTATSKFIKNHYFAKQTEF